MKHSRGVVTILRRTSHRSGCSKKTQRISSRIQPSNPDKNFEKTSPDKREHAHHCCCFGTCTVFYHLYCVTSSLRFRSRELLLLTIATAKLKACSIPRTTQLYSAHRSRNAAGVALELVSRARETHEHTPLLEPSSVALFLTVRRKWTLGKG